MNARWVALLAAIGASIVTGGETGQASCAQAGPVPTMTSEIATANVAFVGLVLYTTDGNRSARVKVESIWKGPALPTFVDIHGEAPGSGPFSGSSEDHYFQSGKEYLFFPRNDKPPFSDYGECVGATVEYTSAVSVYVPAGAKSPEPATPIDEFGNVAGPYLNIGPLAVLAAIAVIWIAVVKRRRRAKGTRD